MWNRNRTPFQLASGTSWYNTSWTSMKRHGNKGMKERPRRWKGEREREEEREREGKEVEAAKMPTIATEGPWDPSTSCWGLRFLCKIVAKWKRREKEKKGGEGHREAVGGSSLPIMAIRQCNHHPRLHWCEGQVPLFHLPTSLFIVVFKKKKNCNKQGPLAPIPNPRRLQEVFHRPATSPPPSIPSNPLPLPLSLN